MTFQQLSPTIQIVPQATMLRDAKAKDERIAGSRLVVARAAWFTLFALSVIYFISGTPTAYRIASTLNPDTVARLHALGLAANFSAIYILALDSITFLLFAGVALLIFKERSDGRMALITSAMLVLTSMLYTAPGYEARAPLWVVAAGAGSGRGQPSSVLADLPQRALLSALVTVDIAAAAGLALSGLGANLLAAAVRCGAHRRTVSVSATG
jgi:hypothetical protein